MCHTVEQQIFATGNFCVFVPQAICVQEIFANLEVPDFENHIIKFHLSLFWLQKQNILVHEIFANPRKFAKFLKISHMLFYMYSNWVAIYSSVQPCIYNLNGWGEGAGNDFSVIFIKRGWLYFYFLFLFLIFVTTLRAPTSCYHLHVLLLYYPFLLQRDG